MKNKFIFAFVFFFNLLLLNASSLDLLWWNVENFFDTTDDPKKRDTVLSPEEYEAKLANISDKLKYFDADIVGLAEVENIFVLEDLAEASNYPYFYLIEGNDPRGIDLCLLAKWEVSYTSHKAHPTPYEDNKNYKFSRDCPEISFDYDGEKIFILLNHLKSKLGPPKESLDKRIAQTYGILDIISEIYKSDKEHSPNLIVMGDLNSYRYSEPLNILQKCGLIIVNYKYNENKVYTNVYRKKKKDIDYFIINEFLYDKVKIKKFKSFNSDEYAKISDHFPLYMELDID